MLKSFLIAIIGFARIGRSVSRTSLLCALPLLFLSAAGHTQSLRNESIQLELAVTPGGSPMIQRAIFSGNDRVIFENSSPYFFMDRWGPQQLSKAVNQPAWELNQDNQFKRAFFSVRLKNGIRRTHVIELAREGTLFRIFMKLENSGDEPVYVDWYPVWKTTWDIPGAQWVKSWEALTYEPFRKRLNVDAQTVLGSRVHSSDRRSDGQVPYWIVGGEEGWVNFSLEWCGGWKAELAKNDYGVEWSVWLPQEETQLLLGPGESVTGPVVTIVPTRENSEMAHRAEWVRQRSIMAEKRFGGPQNEYFLIWNHWYSIEFDVNRTYLLNQLPLLDEFGFDAFVIDAGWYTHIGDWSVSADKFTDPAQLKSLLTVVKSRDMYAGLWSCPQFGLTDQAAEGELFEVPKFYRPFLSGAALYDLYGMNFERFLVDHVDLLVNGYGADWWKYDQDFFARHSKNGLLKNVEEFQRGLVSVRRQFQDLYIENCQSGGRMVNDLTSFAADIHWLRDGGRTGYEHARTNIAEVLGAMQFLPGWTCQRWNNRWHENDPADDQLTKYYCRSAMPGVWGISEDLSEVDERQLATIRQEVEHYRRLNRLKGSGLWDILYPDDRSEVAAITFYDESGSGAALLIFRWNASGEIALDVPLTLIDSKQEYLVQDVDSQNRQAISGQQLLEGFPVRLGKDQLSALYFMESQ